MTIPYRIFYEGKHVGHGGSQPHYALLNVIVKRSNVNRKYRTANEAVSLAIAQYLHLPVPPGGIVMDQSGTHPHFFSLEFLTDSSKPIPPVDPRVLVETSTDICWGITLFDALIINKDRTIHNLAFDNRLQTIYAFDHGNCLLGPHGQKRLDRHTGVLGTGNHCLEKHLKTATGYAKWISFIKEMPNQFIQNAVYRGEGVGYSAEDCQSVSRFLIERKDKLHQLVLNQPDKFLSLSVSEREKLRQMNL